jgi:2-polyprenyl-3-methyl-5-hydroxy-6-metoxy-1,4-benzoquinol methylase
MKITGLGTMLYNRLHRERIYSQSDYWNARAAFCAGNVMSMWQNEWLNSLYHQEVIDFLDRSLPDLRGKRVLDLGCGTGRLSRYLAAKGGCVLGIDFAARALDVARQQSPGDNPIFRVQSMLNLDDIAEYDVAVSWGAISFACRNRDDVSHLMARIYRSLKPGGEVLLLEPIHNSFLSRVLKVSRREFLSEMTAVGFHAQNIGALHFWPSRLLLAYISWPAFITSPAYYSGQWIMRTIFGSRRLGDYYAIRGAKEGGVQR